MNQTAGLCNRYNAATNPAAFRTDHEAARCRQLARAIKNRMSRNGIYEGRDYNESDYSGRLIPSAGR